MSGVTLGADELIDVGGVGEAVCAVAIATEQIIFINKQEPSRRATCLELEWRINKRRVRSPTVREGNFRKAPSLTVGF